MRVLGQHPDTGEDITVRRGPYGLYVQQGENGEDKKRKPRRTSLPRGMDGDQITLEQALGLLSLPRAIGMHPETHEPIEAGIGRFGPYVRMGAVFGSLDRDDDVLAIGINRAVDLIASKMASVRTLGAHPADKELVAVRKGRFGPYVQHGKTVANLPRGVMMEEITLERGGGAAGREGQAAEPARCGGSAGGARRRPRSRRPRLRRRSRRTAKPAKRRASKAKGAAPKPTAKRIAAAKTPAKKNGGGAGQEGCGRNGDAATYSAIGRFNTAAREHRTHILCYALLPWTPLQHRRPSR